MAIESKTFPTPLADLDQPVIENEIPAYRAISAAAVTSLVLGACSVFCFTSLWFLLVAGASVLFGWTALRTIRRLPDILTGTRLAQTGIGLGVLFGGAATSQIVAQDLMLSYEASQFAKMYVNVIKSESLPLALWYRQTAAYRKDKSPEEVVEDLKKATSRDPSRQDNFLAESEQIQAIKDRLKDPKQDIHFAKLESKLVDGLTYYANALIDLDGPDSEQYALLDMIKMPGGGRSDWQIREIKYPYKLASAGVQVEKKDDGHGHGGGH